MMIKVAVNQKEYLEKCRNKDINKKHKGMRKSVSSMVLIPMKGEYSPCTIATQYNA